MHSIFEEFFVVLSHFPFVLFHQFAIFVEGIGIVILRITFKELTAFTFCLFNDFGSKFARQTSGFTQNHIPDIIGNHSPTFFSFFHCHHVHHGEVLHVLAERSHQWRITDTRPYVSYFIKELDEQLVLRHKRQIVFCLIFIDRFQIGFEIGHQTTHHTAGKSGSNQQGVHQAVFRADIQAEEVVHKFLNHAAHFHVGFHIDFGHLISGVFQHCLHAKQVSVTCSP